MGCARSSLFPLLLLSKLVSKLDVLPGQFEVALLPPHPQSCQHTGGQAPRRAWGTGGKGLELLLSTIKGFGGARKAPPNPPTQCTQVLARVLAGACKHLSQSLGEPRESGLETEPLPTSDLHPH